MLVIIICFVALLLLVHIILIESYRQWFLKVKPFESVAHEHKVSFSIIIPARNEEKQIEACLLTVLQQQYPIHLFQVIVVDDFSIDRTPIIVRNLQGKYANLKLIQLENLVYEKQLNSYKKKAIEIAIQQATGDWIVTTDADCMVTDKWLSNFDGYIQKYQPVFIAAPVQYTDTGSFVSRFQCLDFISLQGITAASVQKGFHSMCNGANLAYKKETFAEVGGFKGIDNIASGDDMLLMHKVYLKYPKRVKYLHSQSSVVCTEPMPTWKEFLNQRIRWASKADKFQDKRIFIVLAFIYLFNLCLFLLPIMAIFFPVLFFYWVVLLIAKTFIELRFMFPVTQFFNQQKLLWWFPIMQPFHIAYTVLAGWLGKFGKYSWKGRVVK